MRTYLDLIETYRHLSLEERERFYALKEKGLSLRVIARQIGRDHSTLVREFRRHTRYGRAYLPCRAENEARRWAARQRYCAPLKEPLIFLYVREHLRKPYCWSPEIIAGRLSLDYPGYTIDKETVYRYVYGWRQRRMKLWRYLVLHRKRRLKKDGRKVKTERLADALPLEMRPEVINRRLAVGHWETDNMEGRRSDKTSVSVSVERRLRLTRIRKLQNHTAIAKSTVLITQFRKEPVFLRGTITVDRGSENSRHKKVSLATGMPVYACNPYHSWEKGTVENTIGKVRRFFPKGESVDVVSWRQLMVVENYLNNLPRKCLGFLTPNEVYRRIC